MKTICFSFALLVLTSSGFSQTGRPQPHKEVFVKDSVTHNITQMEVKDEYKYEGTDSKEAHDSYNKAVNYSEAGDVKNAVKFYQKAIEADNKYVKAYDNLGLCYRKLGDYDKAIENYKKSIELFPIGSMAHQNLAVVYGLQKNYRAAEVEYRTVSKMDTTNPEGYFGLANVLMMQERYEEALVFAQEALKIYEAEKSPLLNEGQYMAGVICYLKGDKDLAKKYLKQAKKNGANIP